MRSQTKYWDSIITSEDNSKRLGVIACHNGLVYEIMKDGTLITFGVKYTPNRPNRSLRELAEAHGLYDFRINWRNLTWTARSFAQKEREQRIFINH